MNPSDSQDLLAEYVRNGSESAFRELVNRYLQLVYSTAVRCVDGDAHRAEDITQMVFLDLARIASRLSKDTLLGGWLHRHTCYVASTFMRGERRRLARERQAVEMSRVNESGNSGLTQLTPVLDAAINELEEEDRKAILLRFYERLDLRTVGLALGSSENAAQKRVSRALEQLHLILTRRGVTISVAGLSALLTAEALTAAPSGLTASIVSTAMAGAAAGTGISVTLFKLSTLAKLKIGVAAAIVAGGIATPIWLEHQSQLRLQAENASLRQQLNQTSVVPADPQPEFQTPEARSVVFARSQGSSSIRPTASALGNSNAEAMSSSRGTRVAALPNPAQVTAVPVLYSVEKGRTRFYSASGSSIKMQGESNIHDWQAESTLLGGFLDVGSDFPVEPGQYVKPGLVQATGEVFVTIRSLKSIDLNGKPFSDRMDEVMYQALKAHDHPKIEFYVTQLSLTQRSKSSDLPHQFEAKGELMVAGVTNPLTMAVSILAMKDKKLKISGSTSIKMTDFDINTANLGPDMLRVGDDVKLTFTWVVRERKPSSN